LKVNGKAEGPHDFAMKCPVEGCETILSAPARDGILVVWDRHRVESHLASPAQYTEAQKKIEEATERAKRGRGKSE
jgi:hypothetical protein